MIVRTPSGRGYGTSRPNVSDSFGESTPVDPRTDLPDHLRTFADVTLPDGTVYRDWQDGPLTEQAAPIALPAVDDGEPYQTWTRDKPRAPGWVGPLGPRHRRA